MDGVVVVVLLVVALLGFDFERAEQWRREGLEKAVVGRLEFDLSGARQGTQHYGILGVDILDGARYVFPQWGPQERVVVFMANVSLRAAIVLLDAIAIVVAVHTRRVWGVRRVLLIWKDLQFNFGVEFVQAIHQFMPKLNIG